MNRTVPALRPPRPPVRRSVTEEQLCEIRDLLDELDGPIAEVVFTSMGTLEMTESEADRRLVALRLRKRVIDMASAAARSIHNEDDETRVPLGLHTRNGVVYRVKVGAASRLRTVEVLDLSIHRFQSVSRTLLTVLSTTTLMTREEAQDYGRQWGLCVRCGVPLEGASAALGMGPTCAKRWNQ